MNEEHTLKGKTFDPEKGWYSERTFIFKPGSSEKQIYDGLNKLLAILEDEMVRFIPVKYRRCHVRFYRLMPKPPKEGRIGWRYEP